MKRTLFNRFKTALWNFILPPHVHLLLPKQEKEKEAERAAFSAISVNAKETKVGSKND